MSRSRSMSASMSHSRLGPVFYRDDTGGGTIKELLRIGSAPSAHGTCSSVPTNSQPPAARLLRAMKPKSRCGWRLPSCALDIIITTTTTTTTTARLRGQPMSRANTPPAANWSLVQEPHKSESGGGEEKRPKSGFGNDESGIFRRSPSVSHAATTVGEPPLATC